MLGADEHNTAAIGEEFRGLIGFHLAARQDAGFPGSGRNKQKLMRRYVADRKRPTSIRR